MKANDGLTLWLVVIQLLVVLKTGFVSGVCDIPSSTILLTENVPKDTVVANLTTDNWSFSNSTPFGYITLQNNTFGYFYLKTAKVIDVEEMKRTMIKVVLICNGEKIITFPVTERNEYPPLFTNTSYTIQVKEASNQ
ncbi:uncharacterized protein LOC106871504 [Octopus bimaculoides]|uniref:Cadherin domain-containing protein n=1 Tax=Octopus bimaculoides TaxID=37653 RepID=A0A0L8HE67_OCTBM|nr:uncharacterized protein LOC106871504 [Octopus bimaculoides]XP_052832147.1 uncharacterized protein LOC106871504 [Octopus bimaculoides]|eukprot:XP_014773479.1 PREDICTED: uncharacterized protein LOC106871504 [Octopus bimaculoides]